MKGLIKNLEEQQKLLDALYNLSRSRGELALKSLYFLTSLAMSQKKKLKKLKRREVRKERSREKSNKHDLK